MVQVKICGLRSIEQAVACVDAGADAIGLNFWEGTPRSIDSETAVEIVLALEGRVDTVGVFVNASEEEIRSTLEATGIEWVQLHGDEPPDFLESFLPLAYKAIGVGEGDTLAESRLYGGEHVLFDARVPGAMPGGTGQTFDWALAEQVAQERKLTLAGGLSADNVRKAIKQVRPYRVDVASGVERAPGDKDIDKVKRLIAAVREEGSSDAGIG